MWLRLPQFNKPGWLKGTWRYSKLIQHPLLSIILTQDSAENYFINLSSKPYVNVTVRIKSLEVTIDTPTITFTPEDYNTPQMIDITGIGTIRFDDAEGIIIPSSEYVESSDYYFIVYLGAFVKDDGEFVIVLGG